jgi:hypothetical protein
MSRSVPGGMATAFGSSHFTGFHLIELQFTSGTIYLTTCPHDVPWNSITWQSVFGVGSVDVVKESGTSVEGIELTLSNVNTANIANALAENIQGRKVILRFAVVDGSGTMYVDTNVWTGKLDTMPIIDAGFGGTGSVKVTAESDLIDMDVPRMVRLSDAEQRRVSSTDRFYEYAASLANTTITWPNKEFFKK